MNILWVFVPSLAFMLQSAHGQYQQQQQQETFTTPVPILKQIDRHNEDGSYTYGYEAADKSFKIETKYPNGEVFGKYGYLDDQGKAREIEYGASKRGFEPAGSDINVPPPTLTSSNPYPLGPNELDDGQYREDPGVYHKNQKYHQPIAASKFSLDKYQQQPRLQTAYKPQAPQYYSPAPAPQPGYRTPPQAEPQRQTYQPQPQTYQPQPQAYQPQPQAYQPQPQTYQPQPQAYQPQPQAYQPQPFQPQPTYHQPQQPQYNDGYNGIPNHHHPAVKNLDIWSGSYSIDYTGRK